MYNKVIMIGNLTRDIELRYLPSGSAVAKSAIATTYKYKTQSGDTKEETCFLDFNIFGKTAEIANQYLNKGSKVLLEGRLVLEHWTAQDGSARSKHSLRIEEMKMLGSKPNTQQGHNKETTVQGQQQTAQHEEYQEYDINDDEIPF